MKSKTLKLGTRGSLLAMVQSRWVATQLSKQTGYEVELTIISTRGDQIIDKPLAAIGGKGLFTVELESALHSGEIDFAVHSLKDLPTDDPDGLCIGAIPKRADPRDAIVGLPLSEASVVGTGSARRKAQILRLHPHVTVQDIRGNVDTRLQKLDSGQYDSIVLAMAGLERLSIQRQDIRPQDSNLMISAAGQGALAVQCASKNQFMLELLQQIDDDVTRRCVTAERQFLAKVGGGCHAAVGCLVEEIKGELCGQAFIAYPDFVSVKAAASEPLVLAQKLVSQLRL